MLNQKNIQAQKKIETACQRTDSGEYLCHNG